MRVLVVEDSRRLAAGLEEGLTAGGFAVDVAANGVDGLWLAKEHAYDAVVLDIMLPGLNGYQVCAALREAGNWTPILMLTAKDGELDEVEGLDTGADDYLTKPFSYAVLQARLRAVIRRGAEPRPVALAVGAIRFDPAARRTWLREDELTLTSREQSVLEYLMRRAGQVVTKQEILQHVWDFNFEGDPNIVEVYIKRLRRKVGRDAVETVRGAGYRMAADAD